MARYGSTKSITPEVLHDEVRFVLKTLLRDDLFGEVVVLTEAEKLLDSSLSMPFSEYTAFLKRHGYVEIDRLKNTIAVLPRGRTVSEGLHDGALLTALQSHFAAKIDATAAIAAPPITARPVTSFDVLKDVVKVGSGGGAR
jgi:hypothetical protein